MNVQKFADNLKLDVSNNLNILKINIYPEKNNIIMPRYIRPSIKAFNLEYISGIHPMNGTDNGYLGVS